MVAPKTAFARVLLIAAACVFVAIPGRAVAFCDAPTGLRYPLFDWRAVNGGRLPQTFTYPMVEDTLEVTIEDGSVQNLAPTEMSIVLKTASKWMWKKEIAAFNMAHVQTVSSVVTETSNQGPSAMRITQAAGCSDGGANTIVFRKIDALGWFMRDMYFLDIDHFWSTLGGKIVTFKWMDENKGNPQYPPTYLAPFTIPSDRNLSAVSWAQPNNGKRIDLFETNNGGLRRSWTVGFGWIDDYIGQYTGDDYWEVYSLTSGPAATAVAYGSFNVFVRTSNCCVKFWDGTRWRLVDGNITSNVSGTSWGVDRLDIAARGSDLALYTATRIGQEWAGRFTSLGGVLTSSPALVSRGFSSLDVFARGTDAGLHMRSYTSSGWGPWVSLGGILTSDPAAVVYAPGKMAVFARGTDNALWMNTHDGSRWSGWSSLGGLLTSAPAAASSRRRP